MICIDNSEHNRNGDYIPNRLVAQIDAVNMLSSRKINPPSHPESTVGILTMGGKRGVEVRIPPTRDTTKLLTATTNLSCGGSLDFVVAIKIAQLALKHRQNKAGEQRVVAFVSSPIVSTEKELKSLANSLRKEGISVDVVSMGEVEENEKLLKDFVEQVDKDGSSHLVTIPAGSSPSSVLSKSPVFGGGDNGGSGGGAVGGGGGFGDIGGIDPNEDPELAMVMQMSLMEERARQQEGAAKAGEDASGDTVMTPAGTASTAGPTSPPRAAAAASSVEMSEDELLQQALALSMLEEAETAPASSGSPKATTAPTTTTTAAPVSPSRPTPAAATTTLPAPTGSFLDPSFVQGMLADLPGVDLSDPRILAAMQALQNPGGSTAPKTEEKKEDKK